MKKILVIETGGTFATNVHGNIRSLERAEGTKTIYDYEIVRHRLDKYAMDLTISRPIYTLSENMTPEKLNILIEYLSQVDYTEFDGIILIHGTDTLAYTANIISMLYFTRKIPIVNVSSNHPLDQPLSNGVTNFISALDFIQNCPLQGVYVVYKNYADTIEVHLGSRVKQMNQVIDAYESFKNQTFGIIRDGVFYQNTATETPTLEQIKNHETPYEDDFHCSKRVLLLYPYVGLRYDFYNINEAIDAIVCGVYHSGTINSENLFPDQSINTLIQEAEKYDIPIFIGELTSGEQQYESVSNIAKSPVVFPVYDISLENTYAKVVLGLSVTEDNASLYEYVNHRNISFEKMKSVH